MKTQLATPEQYRKANELYRAIDKECDARIWNKDGRNEDVYRTLKSAVRAWDSAQTMGVIDEEGFLLIDPAIVEIARQHETKKATSFGETREWYLTDPEYRISVNLGTQAISLEGLRDLSAAQLIYDTYNGQFDPPVESTGPTYSEQVLAGTYRE